MLNLRLEGELRNLQGGATLTTALRYDPDRQEFFLDDAEFERLVYQLYDLTADEIALVEGAGA